MEKNQYKLAVEVLRRLEQAGVLDKVVLIGSWCIPCYKNYFSKLDYTLPLRTRDIDFLVSAPRKLDKKVDVPELLKDLGFLVGFKGSEGYIQLQHPALMIEFLVPEKGKGIDTPFPLPQLGLNAQTLRFLELLAMRTIATKLEGVKVVLPHPAVFALHKLLVAQRRKEKEKAEKDKRDAVIVIRYLLENNEKETLQTIFHSLPKKWKQMISKSLEEENEKDILQLIVSRED